MYFTVRPSLWTDERPTEGSHPKEETMFRKTMIGAMHVLVLGALLVPVVQAAVPAEDGQHAQTSSPAVDTFTAAAREHGAAGYGN